MWKKDNIFYLALDLQSHPILNESDKYRENYINALYYFFCKYSNNKYEEKLLDRYSKIINSSCKVNKLEKNEIKKIIKKICKYKFKNFKFFNYRFVFLCDCFLINAYNNPKLGKEILNDFKQYFNSRYYKYLDELYDSLYVSNNIKGDFILANYQINQWIKNKKFINQKKQTILITATMSAGKSSLINSIIGKKLAETRNEACTSSVNSYTNKAFEDNIIVKKNNVSNMEYINYNDFSFNKLSKDIDNEICVYMSLSTYNKNLCLIDTPGVNSSLNKEHSKITENVLDNVYYDKMIYVINANNIGVEDDMKHMINIYNKNVDKPIIFLLNKVDTYRLKEDSIEESINIIKDDICKIGFKNAIVCPISAYAAGIFKKVLTGNELDEDEEFECNMLIRKFSKPEFDLSKYYPNKCEVEIGVNKENYFGKYDCKAIAKCLYNTGIINLENLLMEGEDV